MAIYHCTCKIISRGKASSAVGAAAYRSGTVLKNERDGVVHDYTRKRGIVYSEIILPYNVPTEWQNRGTLWNAVEKIEKSNDSQLAREFEVALPRELDRAEQIKLIQKFAKENFISRGMCVDFSIHDKNDGNPHAHILLTTRPLKENGEWGVKERKTFALDKNGERIPIIDKTTGKQRVDGNNRKQWKREYVQVNDWNKKEFVHEVRADWAYQVNRELERKGITERIDHRSFVEQGVQKIPTIHVGATATAMKRKGKVSNRANINIEIQKENKKLEKLNAFIDNGYDRLIYQYGVIDIENIDEYIRRGKGDNGEWVAVNRTPLETELIVDTKNINRNIEELERKEQLAESKPHSGYYSERTQQLIDNINSNLRTLYFIEEHEVFSLEQISDKIKELQSKRDEISATMKNVEPALEVAYNHITIINHYHALKKKLYSKPNKDGQSSLDDNLLFSYEQILKKHNTFDEKSQQEFITKIAKYDRKYKRYNASMKFIENQLDEYENAFECLRSIMERDKKEVAHQAPPTKTMEVAHQAPPTKTMEVAHQAPPTILNEFYKEKGNGDNTKTMEEWLQAIEQFKQERMQDRTSDRLEQEHSSSDWEH